MECRVPGTGEVKHVLRKHRDFAPSVGTVGETERDGYRSSVTGRKKGRSIRRFGDACIKSPERLGNPRREVVEDR